MDNSYIVDNIRDDLIVSHAFADNYTSIIHSCNFEKDRSNLITNGQEIV